MTALSATSWVAGGVPAVAAPLAAVDAWRAEQVAGELAVSAKVRVRGEDPQLRGHFPGLAVFPGVFIVEAVCQAVMLAVPGSPALCTLRSVRFLAPLLDGDQLTLDITASPALHGGWSVAAVGTRTDGSVAARIRAEFDTGELADA